MLSGLSDLVEKHPTSFGRWAMFGLEQAFGTVEIALLGGQAREAAKHINENYYFPEKLMQASSESRTDWPLLAGKMGYGDLAIYVCRNSVCSNPVNSLAEFEQMQGSTSSSGQ